MLVKEILSESAVINFSDDVISLYRDILYSCRYIRYHKLFLNFKDVGDTLDEEDILNNINEIKEIIKEYEQLSTAESRSNNTLLNKKKIMDFRINMACNSMNKAKPYPPIDYSSLQEDIIDLKATDGQLSPMSVKRPKTKKDKARSDVEKLFKEK